MKKLLLYLLLLLSAEVFSQNPYAETIVVRAKEMAGHFFKKDYNSYVDYVYPGLIYLAGGKENLVAATKEAIEKMESNGMQFKSIVFGKPSGIVHSGTELQVALPQTLTIALGPKTMTAEYTLIAVSTDNGKLWYFVDTSGKGLEEMRKLLPNLSTDLVIPEKKQQISE